MSRSAVMGKQGGGAYRYHLTTDQVSKGEVGVISRVSAKGLARTVAVLGLTLVVLAGCGRKPAAAPSQAKSSAPLLLSPDDLLTIRSNTLSGGPSITGSVQPKRKADLRAEVAAVVLSVLKENGDPVRRGDLLVRLDETAIRDTLVAAEESDRAATQAYEQAERQFQRMVSLREAGLVSIQQVEDAQGRRDTARSDREAAKTRVVTARQQLGRTEVRAPFDGIVSDRQVSAGDTVQIGKELVKVIDPDSMRFEGLVSADSIGEVRSGQRVGFRIHGYSDRAFQGTVARVNPAANVTTRQVEVLVTFDDAKHQPNVAGLYAEGHVETRHSAGLSIPASALVHDGDDTFAWRVDVGVLRKVKLTIGDRDARSGEFVLREGLAEGATLLRYPSSTLHDGQQVQLEDANTPSSALADSTQAAAATAK